MRIVLDTNSLLVSIGRASKYRPIFDAIINEQVTLLLSNDIFSEYTEILERRTSPLVARNIGDFLLRSPAVQEVEIFFKWSIIFKDADDNKFVDCALNGNANYLVSDDKHFNILKELDFPPVRLVRTADFLNILTESNS